MIGKKILSRVCVLMLGLTLFACNEEATLDDVIVEEVDSTSMENEIDSFESPDEDYHLPSALQVASIFRKSGLMYNSEITNSTDNVTNYTTDVQSKLNFGVYSADLAYCITNDEVNDARNFITAVQSLADQQGMESVFEDQELLERFDKNLGNQDKLNEVIVEIHERSQEYLEENDMNHIAAVHYAGAWTEGMYLGVYDYEHSEGDNSDVGSKLTEQIEILSNIIKGLRDPKNADADLSWIIQDLESLQSAYDKFESVKAYNKSGGEKDLVLEESEIKELGTIIKGIRVKIIEK